MVPSSLVRKVFLSGLDAAVNPGGVCLHQIYCVRARVRALSGAVGDVLDVCPKTTLDAPRRVGPAGRHNLCALNLKPVGRLGELIAGGRITYSLFCVLYALNLKPVGLESW